MTRSLPVDISRDELHSLEVPATFEADGSFDILLRNHGESLHVHLHLDDALAVIADIDAGNHYVEGESERAVRVDIDTEKLGEEPYLGKLKVASAYGAQTRWIDVKLTEPTPEDQSVQVGEQLAEPQPTSPGEQSLLEHSYLPVVALGALALLIAFVATVFFQETIITVGALVVLGGVVTALFFLSREAVGV